MVAKLILGFIKLRKLQVACCKNTHGRSDLFVYDVTGNGDVRSAYLGSRGSGAEMFCLC